MTFYHGTNEQLGEVIDPSQPYTRKNLESARGTVYFTSDVRRAQFYAERVVRKHGGEPRIFIVEPTGEYHQDWQTRRAPENQRTTAPLKVLGEYTAWVLCLR